MKIAVRLLLGLAVIFVLTGFDTACKYAKPKLEDEIARIRQLAAAGDLEALADALDESVARIPAGEFVMGSEAGPVDEQPQRKIYLDGFLIDRFEVTNAQYRRFVLATGVRAPQYWVGEDIPPGQADLPVLGVSWAEANAYCEWAGKRLPSEAEWEKACRGPEGLIYPWGNEWDASRANVGLAQASHWSATIEDIWRLLESALENEGYPGPQPVGSFPQGVSAYGILDMCGNVAEWVQDWYTWQGYQDIPPRNPVGSAPPWNHSVRGSGWVDRDGEQGWVADVSRCAKRNSSHATHDPRLGFRCARSADG